MVPWFMVLWDRGTLWDVAVRASPQPQGHGEVPGGPQSTPWGPGTRSWHQRGRPCTVPRPQAGKRLGCVRGGAGDDAGDEGSGRRGCGKMKGGGKAELALVICTSSALLESSVPDFAPRFAR